MSTGWDADRTKQTLETYGPSITEMIMDSWSEGKLDFVVSVNIDTKELVANTRGQVIKACELFGFPEVSECLNEQTPDNAAWVVIISPVEGQMQALKFSLDLNQSGIEA